MRQGITLQVVSEAAESLQAQGDNPTIDRIREFLGGTGSNTTTSKYLNAWRQERFVSKENDSSSPPDPVQAAVKRVWQEIRDETNIEIVKIREESRREIELAQKQAIEALEERQKLNQEYIQLQESYNAVSAEKEILTIDLRKLREVHNILEERYHGLDSRYIDMQGMVTHQLKMLTDAHQKEITRLEQTIEQLNLSHYKLIDEIKEQSEAERHRQMMIIEGSKTENQKLNKCVDELQKKLQDEDIKIADLETQLKMAVNDRDNTLKTLTEHEKRWRVFNDKVFVSDDLIRKLNGMPELEKSFSQLDKQIVGKMDSIFSQLSVEINRLAAQMEIQDE